MSLQSLIEQPQLAAIITHPDDDNAAWHDDLQHFVSGDARLDRQSAGESAIKAVQRLMIFLGYSTAASGAFAVDGDFGRGTNRGVAQFLVEHGLGGPATRDSLCYPCRWNTASRLITAVPNITLTPAVLERMATVALEKIEARAILTGTFDSALFHLNALDHRNFLDCRAILARYGDAASAAAAEVAAASGQQVRPEWIMAIIRQETAGVIRPRFEQHWLSRFNARLPDADLAELRLRSMSMGLGQVMGFNHEQVGAASATALFTAPVAEQVAFVARFLAPKAAIVSKTNPDDSDFRTIARYYNGSAYEAHRYHEKLARWFREFRTLL